MVGACLVVLLLLPALFFASSDVCVFALGLASLDSLQPIPTYTHRTFSAAAEEAPLFEQDGQEHEVGGELSRLEGGEGCDDERWRGEEERKR